MNLSKYLKYAAISITTLSILFATTKLIYECGKYSQYKKTAIEKNKIIYITIQSNSSDIRFSYVALAEHPLKYFEEGSEADQIIFNLHQINPSNPSDIKSIGSISTAKPNLGNPLLEFFNGLFDLFAENNQESAIAQGGFSWRGYRNDYDFYEEYVSRNTVRRYYSTGAILQYRIDSSGRAIRSSFTWIRYVPR